MAFIKKLGIGAWLSLLAVITTVVGLIIFAVATNAGNGLEIASGSQPFYDFTRAEDGLMKTVVILFGIIGIVALVANIVTAQFKGKVFEVINGATKIIAPVMLVLVAVYFIYGSFTGLGWTFFSNEELEIYDAAKAVGGQVITCEVFFVISSLIAVVTSFFAAAKAE